MDNIDIDLGLDIDQMETSRKVRAFFKKTFPNYLIKAGYHRTDLSSPQLDLTGIAARNGNGAEGKMMHILDMQDRCKVVYQAIDHCADSTKQAFRTILKALYIDELDD